MKKQKTIKKDVSYLDYMCQIGEIVQWKDMSGKKYVGKLIAMDSECLASVKLDDGTVVQYQC